jgi:drug/metabolite transporter (DMT)-like permease
MCSISVADSSLSLCYIGVMPRFTLSSGPAIALLSAALFGASTPFAKLLLGDGLDAWMLAGLLYLGSGLGLAAVWMLRKDRQDEARLVRKDWSWMGLIVLAGGVAGPVLLMIGLASTPASTAALLLNVEGLATMGIAWLCCASMWIGGCWLVLCRSSREHSSFRGGAEPGA